jgi:xylulokinase
MNNASTPQYILTIDLGTSGPKVALISTQGQIIDYESEACQLFLLPNGGAEQSPAEWWTGIKNAIKRLLGKQLVPADSIVALSCTGQWSGTVAVDRSGNPLMNAIIWMDSRGAPYVQHIMGGLLKINGYGLWKAQKWLRLTGGAPAAAGKDPIAHILYIKHTRPDIYQATYQFLEPKDYLNLRFTGKFAASYDSIALHWLTDNRDLTRVDYNQQLVELSTIDRAKLPDLKRAVDILGPLKAEVARELGLSRDVEVVMGTPDVQSAAIGSGAVADFQGHVYLGTSSWLTCHVPFKKTDLLHNMAALPSAIPQKYFVANEQESAGACLAFLRDKILCRQDELASSVQPSETYAIFNQIAERTPAGSNNLIFTPWLYGERTPVENHTMRGGFYNLSLNHTRDHLVRATFEGAAYNSRWLLGYVERFIKRPFEALNMIGGGANSNIWCQIYADVLNRPIRQVKQPILANLRGAAFLASVALSQLTFEQVSDRVEIANTYHPNPNNRQLYDGLFKEFINIYNHNRKIYARLNRY